MNRWADLFVRWMPDAFSVALILTLISSVCAVGFAHYPVMQTVEAWGDGFWNLLEFTNQITLTLLLGYALAATVPVQRLLKKAAGQVRSARAAYMTACFLTGVLALFSWGLSLVSAGIIARAIGSACQEKGIRVHYPLLVASAFSGFVIWHQGLTSSIGLVLATPGHFLEHEVGLIPTSETIFTLWNLSLALFILFVLPPLMARLHPSDDGVIREFSGSSQNEPALEAADRPSPAQRMDQSPWLILPILLMSLAYVLWHFLARSEGLELNILNFVFLFVGVALAGSAGRYAQIIVQGGRVAAPFLLQYPFYAGIAGVIAKSGLASMIIEFFASISSPVTLPFFAFLSAGLLNIFIPSGGGQWAVQGPLMMSAAMEAGAELPRVAMAVALGDQWTNLIQPLTLIPVITISGARLREVVPYTFVALVFTGAAFALSLFL